MYCCFRQNPKTPKPQNPCKADQELTKRIMEISIQNSTEDVLYSQFELGRKDNTL